VTTFLLSNSLAIFGGFAGDETSISERNVLENETILSGDVNGDDDPNYPLSFIDNSCHVVSGSYTDNTAILDGFTITAGNAESYGGGLYIAWGNPTVRDCLFFENSAGEKGDNIYCWYSSPKFNNCSISGNNNPDIADVWMENGSVQIVDTFNLENCFWFGNNLLLEGSGTLEIDSTTTLDLRDSTSGSTISLQTVTAILTLTRQSLKD